MTIESAQDLAGMIEDWGDTIVVNGSTISGLFDEEYADAIGVDGVMPRFICTDTDASAVSIGDTGAVTSDTYGATATTYTIRRIIRYEPKLTSLIVELASFIIRDIDGNWFTVGLSVLDSDGNSFTVSLSVLDSDGNSYSMGAG